MKKVYSPFHCGHVIVGGRKNSQPGPHLKLSKYKTASLPAAPVTGDYSTKAMAELSRINRNDVLGCCVVAAGYHNVGVWTGNATGTPFVATDDQITFDYEKIGNYDPKDPNTDQGCDMRSALNYWQSVGFADGSKLLGWLAVDASNAAEIMSALDLFEVLWLGMCMPDAYVNPMPQNPGFLWGVAGAPDQENGHCIMACGWDANKKTIKIDTWGMLGEMTLAAVAKYGAAVNSGELYIAVSPDMLAKGQTKCPNGIDWAALISDFNSIGGKVPVPPAPVMPPIHVQPTPKPQPIPPLSVVPWWQQVINWISNK